jgi:hypothetical protein
MNHFLPDYFPWPSQLSRSLSSASTRTDPIVSVGCGGWVVAYSIAGDKIFLNEVEWLVFAHETNKSWKLLLERG